MIAILRFAMSLYQFSDGIGLGYSTLCCSLETFFMVLYMYMYMLSVIHVEGRAVHIFLREEHVAALFGSIRLFLGGATAPFPLLFEIDARLHV